MCCRCVGVALVFGGPLGGEPRYKIKNVEPQNGAHESPGAIAYL